MGYFIIADLTVRKYTIYHLREDEPFYHDFRDFVEKQTGHCVLASVQTDPMVNTEFRNIEDKDGAYFEPYLIQFRSLNKRKK